MYLGLKHISELMSFIEENSAIVNKQQFLDIHIYIYIIKLLTTHLCEHERQRH